MQRHDEQQAQWLGFPCFLLDGCFFPRFFVFLQPMRTFGGRARNVANRFPLFFGHFLKCLCYSETVSHKVFDTIWVFLNVYNTHYVLAKNSPSACRRISQSVSKKKTFFSFSLKYHFHVYIYKNKRCERKILNLQQFFSYFALSYHTTFSQSQIDVIQLDFEWLPCSPL